jgi:hypothetical protein
VQEPDRPVENAQFGIAIGPQHPNISLSCRRKAAVEKTGLGVHLFPMKGGEVGNSRVVCPGDGAHCQTPLPTANINVVATPAMPESLRKSRRSGFSMKVTQGSTIGTDGTDPRKPRLHSLQLPAE